MEAMRMSKEKLMGAWNMSIDELLGARKLTRV
jgi:hypothetical protein